MSDYFYSLETCLLRACTRNNVAQIVGVMGALDNLRDEENA